MMPIDVPVDGGALRVLRFGTGPRLVVAAHGISASGMSFGAVARHLPDDWSLAALDLRGRGGSAELPGPYGMDRHAEDIAHVVEHLDAGPVVLVGQSMGAYAALRAAARRPELVERLVLVDGGLPLPVPDGADVDELVRATIGPALARLGVTYPSVEAYLDFFRAHPALGPYWSEDIEEYVRYDVTGPEGALRTRVHPEAVRVDGRELLASASSFGDDLATLVPPTLLLYAPRGMLDQPPGMLPEPLVAYWHGAVPRLRVELVPDVNHYTILLGTAAKLLAARITDQVTWPASCGG
jgi:pimeloyl-ACP methyl ester carboxylesterase